MTRKTEIEVAAYDYAREQLSNPDYPTYNDEYELECAFEAGTQWANEHPDIEAIKAIEDHAYFAGSEAMREKMIEKACERLYEQLNSLKMECGNIMEFIEHFKKAMDL